RLEHLAGQRRRGRGPGLRRGGGLLLRARLRRLLVRGLELGSPLPAVGRVRHLCPRRRAGGTVPAHRLASAAHARRAPPAVALAGAGAAGRPPAAALVPQARLRAAALERERPLVVRLQRGRRLTARTY